MSNLNRSPITFYADVHISRAVADGLRRKDVDMILGVDVGLQNADDRAHLARAHQEGRVLVTKDQDFLNLHANGLSHSGIVYFKQNAAIGYMIRQLLLLHHVYAVDDMKDRVEFL